MASNFLTGIIAFTLIASQAKADSCDLSKIPSTQTTAKELLTSVGPLLSQGKKCEAAIALKQTMQNSIFEFVQANGFFTLIRTEMELGKYDEALEFYKSWPWEIEKAQPYSPWRALPQEQQAGAKLLIWKLFSKYIPKNADFCVENPLTAKCDEGNGLYNYDETFAQKYPENPYQVEMKNITTLYYDYKIKHENGILQEFILQYENAVHPKAGFHSFLANFRNKKINNPRLVYANCVGPREELPGKCDLVPKHTLLTNVILQSLRMEYLARAEDKAMFSPTIVKYAQEMKNMIAADPDIFKDLIPPMQKMNLDEVIADHGK